MSNGSAKRRPPIPTLIYSPAILGETVPSLIIKEMYVCAGMPVEIPKLGGVFTNYWSLWFVIDNSRSADPKKRQVIKFEMTPEGGPGELSYEAHRGMIIIEEILGRESPMFYSNVTYSVQMDVRRGLVVQDIIDAVDKGEYDRYEFTEQKLGGRFWMNRMISQLQTLGMLTNHKQASEAKGSLESTYRIDGKRCLDECRVIEGLFY